MQRRRFLTALGVGFTGIAGCVTENEGTPSSSSRPSGQRDSRTLYVAPEGNIGRGRGTRSYPYTSIQTALENAEPGDVIDVGAGVYHERIQTHHGGTADDPITISGPTGAIIRPPVQGQGTLPAPVLTISHAHIHLTGCTFDGLANPDRAGEARWYSSLIDVQPEASQDYLTDIAIKPDAVGNSYKALVNLVRVREAEVGTFTVTGPAGVQHLYGDVDGHNGEIVYVGTAIDNLGERWYPWDTVDESSEIHIHHIDNSGGHPHAELVDAKPGTSEVTIEYCTDAGGSGHYLLPGHEHPSEAAVSLSGRDNTLRWCVIENGSGHGVKVDSWGRARQERFEEETGEPFPEAAKDAGQNNAIYGNRLLDNKGKAIRFEMDEEGNLFGYGPDDQRVLCGNEITGESHGAPEKPCPDSVPTSERIGFNSRSG